MFLGCFSFQQAVYNTNDAQNATDRRSYSGEYEIRDGLPLNPSGRTGLGGRGLLYRWGPNHSLDPVITRWARNSAGHFVSMNKRRVLEFVAVKRSDSKRWAIAGGFFPYNCDPVESMKKIFIAKCLNDKMSTQVQQDVDVLFSKGKEVCAFTIFPNRYLVQITKGYSYHALYNI